MSSQNIPNCRVLFLSYENKQYEWPHQFITGAEAKKLIGVAPGEQLYLSVSEPWKDEFIDDNASVDLARPGIEQFYLKQKLKYTIDCKEFDSDKQYIKGIQIRTQGGIQADFEIFLAIKGPWEDELIANETIVDLARPGIENFYSCKPNTTNG